MNWNLPLFHIYLLSLLFDLRETEEIIFRDIEQSSHKFEEDDKESVIKVEEHQTGMEDEKVIKNCIT